MFKKMLRFTGAVGALLALLASMTTVATANPRPISNYEPSNGGASAAAFYEHGGKVFFRASSGSGNEPWVIDSHGQEPRLISDLVPGEVDGVQLGSYPDSFFSSGGKTFFTTGSLARSTHPIKGLAITDGTEAGTKILKQPLEFQESSDSYQRMVNVGDTFYFAAKEPGDGYGLWKSDGSEAGTVKVADYVLMWDMVSYKGSLYFTSTEPGKVRLRRSDGTAEGTDDITNFHAGELAIFDGDLYFVGTNDGVGAELFKTDGTAEGIELVADLVAGPVGSSPKHLTVIGDRLFFTAVTGAGDQQQLWSLEAGSDTPELAKSDLTIGQGQLDAIHSLGDVALLSFREGNAERLWRSDGTPAGTEKLGDFVAPKAVERNLFSNLGNGIALFSANDGETGTELWRTDGTKAGTYLLKDTHGGTVSGVSHTAGAALAGGHLYFTVNGGGHGLEVWVSDGTETGTRLYDDMGKEVTTVTTQEGWMSAANGRVFSWIRELEAGMEPWVSDGSESGTHRVKDVNPGASDAMSFTNARAGLATDAGFFFEAEDGQKGSELWFSDGSDTGSRRVKDIRPGRLSSSPQGFTQSGDQVFFVADDGSHGVELWRTDGTEAGTTMVADINEGSGSSSPSNLFAHDGTLYFSATDGTDGSELWKVRGAGLPELVLDINPGSGSSTPSNFGEFDGRVYFSAVKSGSLRELWVTDGTAAGTKLVKAVADGGPTNPADLTSADGRLFFAAAGSGSGRALWVSDGSEQGTSMVADLNPNPRGGVTAGTLLAHPDGVVFGANDGTTGQEPWFSDGTAEGTKLIADIGPGANVSRATGFTWAGGWIYFSANDGVSGTEMWRISADLATVENIDVIEGPDGSSPGGFTDLGGKLVFVAGPTTMRQIWAYEYASGTSDPDGNDGDALNPPPGGEEPGGSKVSVEWETDSGAALPPRLKNALTKSRQAVRAGRRGLFAFGSRIVCPTAGRDCRARVTVTARNGAGRLVKVGAADYLVAAKNQVRVWAQLSRGGRRLLSKGGPLDVKVRVVMRRGDLRKVRQFRGALRAPRVSSAVRTGAAR